MGNVVSRRWISRLRRQDGQGMTEYIIIVALVAIAAIGVVTVFGDNIRKVFAASAEAVAGDTNATSKAKKGAATKKSATQKDLGNFGADN
jgi:pilus assembly protein Flp/PilA